MMDGTFLRLELSRRFSVTCLRWAAHWDSMRQKNRHSGLGLATEESQQSVEDS